MEDIDNDDYEFNDEAHERLVNAVTKFDKTQHIKQPTRSEPANLTSEFNLIKSSNKIDVNNVVKVLANNAQHVQISKKLKKTQERASVLKRPLEKPQAERLKRSTGYEQTKERVGRWDAVVARSRTNDCVYFPLKRATNKLLQTDEILSKYELKSPLELELEEVDPPPQVDAEEEEDPVYPMTYQEMIEQRQHLAKVRAQQSFTAAKAKRQSKIKSKKYHRILKKEKLKQQLKEFEELQKTDPEEALKKLEALEKERALERHTLRHKNTGKWAKSKLIRAKYDKETRQQLAEQLSISRNLTKKTDDNESSDDEANDETISDLTLAQDPFNPWMLKRPDKSNVDKDFDFGYKKYLNDKKINKEDTDSDSDIELNKDLEVQSNILVQDKFFDTETLFEKKNDIYNKYKKDTTTDTKDKSKPLLNQKKTNNTEIKLTGQVISTTNWNIDIVDNEIEPSIHSSEDISNAFETLETTISEKVTKKLKNIRAKLENNQNNNNKRQKNKEIKEKNLDNTEYLQFKTHNKKAIIDEQLNETNSHKYDDTKDTDNPVNIISKQSNQMQVATKDTPIDNIDPNRFIQAKPKYLNTTINNAMQDLDDIDDEEQVVPKVNIEDVFEEDDVVASFRQEKEDEANKDTVKDFDLSLPGWGSWGGKGVEQPRKRKNNRLILKGAPKVPRKDENKGDIIIKEYKDPKLASHKINQVPFPFTSVKDFESSIRAPIGNTFIPERAHAKLIKPNVITRAGTIIDAMDEDELLLPRNIRYKNQSVIDLLAKNRKKNSKEFTKKIS